MHVGVADVVAKSKNAGNLLQLMRRDQAFLRQSGGGVHPVLPGATDKFIVNGGNRHNVLFALHANPVKAQRFQIRALGAVQDLRWCGIQPM